MLYIYIYDHEHSYKSNIYIYSSEKPKQPHRRSHLVPATLPGRSRRKQRRRKRRRQRRNSSDCALTSREKLQRLLQRSKLITWTYNTRRYAWVYMKYTTHPTHAVATVLYRYVWYALHVSGSNMTMQWEHLLGIMSIFRVAQDYTLNFPLRPLE